MKHDPLGHKVRPVRKRKRPKPLSEEIRSMYRVLSITLCVLGIGAICSYLYLNGLKSAKGYHLKQLQLNYEELKSDERNLEHQIIEAQSFINLESTDSVNQMEQVTSDEFTYLDDSAYAQH